MQTTSRRNCRRLTRIRFHEENIGEYPYQVERFPPLQCQDPMTLAFRPSRSKDQREKMGGSSAVTHTSSWMVKVNTWNRLATSKRPPRWKHLADQQLR